MGAFNNPRGVLNFGVPWRTEGVEYILWPVFAYRLTAPVLPVRHQSNPLEKAVLGLVRSGISSPDELSELSGLAPELIHLITRRLAEGYQPALDSKVRLTEYGRKILDDADEGSLGEATGWIFQDPWTGELWDRFVVNLPTVPNLGEKNIGSGYAPEIDLGTEGKPFIYVPWVIDPKSVAHVQPQAADILRTVRLIDSDNSDNEDDGVKQFKQADIGKVSYLDAEPEAMYCVTALKAHINSGSGDAWSIGDPFRPGKESIRMRRALTLRFASYPLIAEKLAKILDLQNLDQVAAPELFKGAVAVAELEIDGRFGILADKFNVRDRLVELARKLHLLEAVSDVIIVESVLGACGRVVERLMKQIMVEFPASNLAAVLELKSGKKSKIILGQDTEKNIKALGYQEVPRSLLTIDQGTLNYLLRGGNKGSVMSLTLAAILGAFISERHPLKVLAEKHPHLLADIASIADGRNPVSHDEASAISDQEIIAHANGLAKKTFVIVDVVLQAINAAKDSKGERNG